MQRFLYGLLTPAPGGGSLPIYLNLLTWLKPLATAPSVLLAQNSLDLPLHNVVDFLAKVGLLAGICVIIAGGVKIGRGDTEGGLMAIVGGVLIALAVPIMKFLLSLAGINF